MDIVASPNDPMPNARRFVAERYTHGEEGHPLLLHVRNSFYAWTGSLWREVEPGDLRAELYDYFEGALYAKSGSTLAPFEPNRRSVAYLVEAVQAITFRPGTLQAPGWLGADVGGSPPAEMVACANGLLFVPKRRLYAHTPTFFNLHCVPFAYDPDAPAPKRWQAFLDDLWPDDPDSIDCLQEIAGYLISGDTRQQKIFLLVGPRRSGKGTIARVLTRLIGPHHVIGATLSSLGTNFGLQPLVNASVTFISDARLPRGDTSVIAERLLSISGEDTLTVDRKYRDHWTGKLPTRIVVLTNELPRFTEASGALASRFIVLTMTRTFYGAENPHLTDELCEELPGIFNWALEGLDRLQERGRFEQPASSDQAIRELEDLASPCGAFVRDRCEVGPEHEVDVNTLWAAWQAWCDDNGRDHKGTKQTFGSELRTVVPFIRLVQPRDRDGDRYRAYQGISVARRG